MGSGWWHRASTEERLAQIDGCIEVGMTSRQCAINLGCTMADGSERNGGASIRAFARAHGRNFASDDEEKAKNHRRKQMKSGRRRFDVADAKAAYLAGEPIDFWRSA